MFKGENEENNENFQCYQLRQATTIFANARKDNYFSFILFPLENFNIKHREKNRISFLQT